MEKFYFVFRHAACFRFIRNCGRRPLAHRAMSKWKLSIFGSHAFDVPAPSVVQSRSMCLFLIPPKNRNSIETKSIRWYFFYCSKKQRRQQRAFRKIPFRFCLSFDSESFDVRSQVWIFFLCFKWKMPFRQLNEFIELNWTAKKKEENSI